MDEAEFLRAQQRRKRQQQQPPASFQQNGRSTSKPDFKPLIFPGGSNDADSSFAYDGPASQLDRSNPDLNALDERSGAAPPALMQVLHDTLADDGVDESERRRRNRPRRRSSSDEGNMMKHNEQSSDPKNVIWHTDDVETVESGCGMSSANGRGVNAWKLNAGNAEKPGNEDADTVQRGAPLADADAQDAAAPVGDIVSEKQKNRRKKNKKQSKETEEESGGEQSEDETPSDKPRKILAAPSDPYADVDLSDLRAFALRPAPKGVIFKCRVSRDKRGIDKGVYPVYYLHLEHDDMRRTFLLAARRRKKSKTHNYAIATDPIDLARDGDAFIGKLRANFVGSQFSLYYFNCATDAKARRLELAAVFYETNIFGFKGPRKMTVVVPGMNEDGERVDAPSESSLLERAKRSQSSGLVELHNKTPVWNNDTQSYVLNFYGRVTQASVKNFQIVHNNDVDYIVMQFGRVADAKFSLDFSYPLSALQAFGIALSSFDGKLACE